MDTTRKMLRDFTVEELDALPIGSAFRDIDPHWPLPDAVKQTDGWCRGPDEPMLAACDLQAMCNIPRVYVPAHVDEAPTVAAVAEYPPVARAFAPFVAFLASVPREYADDSIVVEIDGLKLTAGDFRRAARFAKSLNPA